MDYLNVDYVTEPLADGTYAFASSHVDYAGESVRRRRPDGCDDRHGRPDRGRAGCAATGDAQSTTITPSGSRSPTTWGWIRRASTATTSSSPGPGASPGQRRLSRSMTRFPARRAR